jgi:hypothetical protein
VLDTVAAHAKADAAALIPALATDVPAAVKAKLAAAAAAAKRQGRAGQRVRQGADQLVAHTVVWA